MEPNFLLSVLEAIFSNTKLQNSRIGLATSKIPSQQSALTAKPARHPDSFSVYRLLNMVVRTFKVRNSLVMKNVMADLRNMMRV